MVRTAGRVVHVVVAVVPNPQGEILLALRPKETHQGGFWEFPGGKLEPGETPVQGLARELREELAIDPLTSEPLTQISHDYGDRAVLLDVYRIEAYRGEPRGNEGQRICWVAPRDLRNYEFPAANREIIDWLSESGCRPRPVRP